MAAGRPIPIRVGDIELLVETVQLAGTEPTVSRAQKAVEHAGEAFMRAQDTIVEVAKSTAEMIEKVAAQAASPDRVEVEFGLRFSATGNIIMAGATAEAALKVTLTYKAKQLPARAP
jgi:Trypsin-co-occurring domain 1